MTQTNEMKQILDKIDFGIVAVFIDLKWAFEADSDIFLVYLKNMDVLFSAITKRDHVTICKSSSKG